MSVRSEPKPELWGGCVAAKMPDVEPVEVILANNDRVMLRVGDVFLKIDSDQKRTDVEVEAMAMAPGPDTGGALAESTCARARCRSGRGTRPPR